MLATSAFAHSRKRRFDGRPGFLLELPADPGRSPSARPSPVRALPDHAGHDEGQPFGGTISQSLILSLAVALGIGLLIGIERERSKGGGPFRAAAGLRTFALASLLGAVAMATGGTALLVVAGLAIAMLAGLAYWRSRQRDPGLTTEVGLVLTVFVGGLAIGDPAVAAGLGVIIAMLLAARSWLHRLVVVKLTATELRDGLLFAAASLIVLPLLPDRALDPFGAFNPHSMWTVVVLVMAISSAGYVAVRVLGARFGLPMTGLASGFISSTATIGAMGARARKDPAALAAAAAGAILSTVSTVVQMTLVIGATSPAVIGRLALALALAGLTAFVYGAVFTILALKMSPATEPQPGRAFSLRAALMFAASLTAILMVSAALERWFGNAGITIAASLSGFVDTHAPAIATASLVAAGKMSPDGAVLPILAAFSTNTVSKVVFAWVNGGPRFAIRVVPGLALVAAAAWLGVWLA